MELRRLRYFLTVAEELHFGRAAARLGLAQPPLSQQIRVLEAEIGAALFERSSRRVVLTPAGAALVGPARDALGAATAGLEAARRAARGESERLAVGFLHSLAYTLLPRLLPAFRARHPEFPVALHEMDAAQQVEALAAGRIGIGLLRPPVAHGLIDAGPLLREPFVAAVPALHRLARSRRIVPADLNGTPMVLYPQRAGPQGFARVLDAWFALQKIAPVPAQEAGTLHTALGLVAAGFGLALVPASLARIRVPDVVFRRLAGPSPEAEVWIASRRDDGSRAVMALRKGAAQILAAQPSPMSAVGDGS